MCETFNPVATLSRLPLTRKERPSGDSAHETNVSEALKLTMLGASYFEVQPGEAAFPFHVHYCEDEILFIVAGSGAYRFGADTYAVKAGDMLSAPAGGAEYAHQLRNDSNEVLKYFCVSNLPDINVGEQPDIGQIGISSRRAPGPGTPSAVRLKRS